MVCLLLLSSLSFAVKGIWSFFFSSTTKKSETKFLVREKCYATHASNEMAATIGWTFKLIVILVMVVS